MLLKSYGYWFVLLGAFFEGESVVLVAGFAAYQGYLDIRWVAAIAFLGSLVGDQLYFRLGRWKGGHFLERYRFWREHVEKVRRLMKRYGLLVILGFRFIYGARTVTPFVIGSSGFDARLFFILNSISAFAWSLLVAYLGYAFGAFMEVLFGNIKRIEHVIVLLLLCAGAVVWILKVMKDWWLDRKKPA